MSGEDIENANTPVTDRRYSTQTETLPVVCLSLRADVGQAWSATTPQCSLLAVAYPGCVLCPKSISAIASDGAIEHAFPKANLLDDGGSSGRVRSRHDCHSPRRAAERSVAGCRGCLHLHDRLPFLQPVHRLSRAGA